MEDEKINPEYSGTMKQEIKITLEEYLMLTIQSRKKEYEITRLLELLFDSFEKNYKNELDIDLGYRPERILNLLEEIDPITFIKRKHEVLHTKEDEEE